MERAIFTFGDIVTFKFKYDDEENYNIYQGVVEVVDAHGTWEQTEEPSYDIMSNYENAPTLFKHIRQSLIIGVL